MRPRIASRGAPATGADSSAPNGSASAVHSGAARNVGASPQRCGYAATLLKVMPAPKRNSLLFRVFMLQHLLRFGHFEVRVNCFTWFKSRTCLADLIIGERKLRSDSRIHKELETEHELYKLTLDKTWYLANRVAC